jgi:hypothetical protein
MANESSHLSEKQIYRSGKSGRRRRRLPQRNNHSASENALANTEDLLNTGTDDPPRQPLPAVSPDSDKYILSEIKWIGIVTGIIIVFLVIIYIFFH